MNPVLCIGELLIDLIAADGSTSLENAGAFVARPGGAPANVAVALARLGVPSAFCGVVGDDPFGRRLRSTLEAEKVDTSRLRSTADADTTIAFAWKDERGDGQFRILRMADRLLDIDDMQRAAIETKVAVVLGSVSLAANPSRSAIYKAIDTARDENVPICLDLNMRPAMWASSQAAREAIAPLLGSTTLLKLSVDDARFLFDTGDNLDAIFAELNALARPFTVLTDGARGAWFAKQTSEGPWFEHVPSFPVKAVEPTGAGDAFTAAIISRLIGSSWSSLETDDVRFASAAGALTTTREGAIDSLPTLEEVNAFMDANIMNP